MKIQEKLKQDKKNISLIADGLDLELTEINFIKVLYLFL
nr:MAG TPA: hypothetical protein [Caudoviricetes sp.]